MYDVNALQMQNMKTTKKLNSTVAYFNKTLRKVKCKQTGKKILELD